MSLLERLERLERIKRDRQQDVPPTDEEEENATDDDVQPAAKFGGITPDERLNPEQTMDEAVVQPDDAADVSSVEHRTYHRRNSGRSTTSSPRANGGGESASRSGVDGLRDNANQSESFSQQLFKRVSNRSRNTQTDDRAEADSEEPKAKGGREANPAPQPTPFHPSDSPQAKTVIRQKKTIEDITEDGTPTEDSPVGSETLFSSRNCEENGIPWEVGSGKSPEEPPIPDAERSGVGSLRDNAKEEERFEEQAAIEEQEEEQETSERDSMRVNQRATRSEEKAANRSSGVNPRTTNGRSGNSEVPSDFYADLKLKLHSKLLDSIPPQLLGGTHSDEQVRTEVERLVNKIIGEEPLPVSRAEREQLFTEVMDEVTGLGPIQGFMRDKEVTEIMVNGPKQMYIERNGKLELTDRVFKDDAHLMRIIQRIIAPINRRVDESTPMVDARLPDGSRVNAAIPPVSLIGPVLNIHKFYKETFTVEDLLEFESLTQEMADFLAACVLARMDIMVSGGTSTGKTTLLSVLSSFIPERERLITIEDAAELKLHQQHVITLESRPAGIAGRGEITIRDIVRNALRMRPDRIIIGEVRGGEALDMLQAMNTGHEGSMSTCHANTPYDMISRLETMVMMAGMNLPAKAIQEQITSAIDIIVHMSRLHDGSRKVMKITEVQGSGDGIVLEDIFKFERKGISEDGRVLGEFKYTGVKPKSLEEFKIAGIQWQGDGVEG